MQELIIQLTLLRKEVDDLKKTVRELRTKMQNDVMSYEADLVFDIKHVDNN